MPQASASDSLLADPSRAARLRSWVVGVGLLALLAFAASAANDTWRSYKSVVVTNNRELGNLAKALAEQADGSLQLADLLLRETAAWYEIKDPQPDGAADARLAARATGLPQVRAVAVVDKQGTIRIRSPQAPPATVAISDRPYFMAHRDHPGLGVLLSDPLMTRIEHRPAVVLSRRLESKHGRFNGIVQATVDLQEFQERYHGIDLGRGSVISLLRDDGTLFVREPPLASATGAKFPELSGSSSKSADLARDEDQRQQFAGIAHLAGFPVVVAVTREKSVALKAWRDEAYRVAAATLVLTLLGAAAIAALAYQVRRIELGERALRQSEERYALAMEGANEGHFDWNFEQGSSFLSAQMKLLHGLSPDAAVVSCEPWLTTLDMHPDDRSRILAGLRDHLDGRSEHYEAEYRVRQPDGQWHWLHARGRCIRDASGRVHRFVGSASDVTARKIAEFDKERLEIELRQSQKLEAIGTLAGGIAHDFNNILGAILGYGELAQKATAEGSLIRRYLENVMHAGGRAKALVERILAFSRSGVGERVSINVQQVVEETIELLAASVPPGVHLDKRMAAKSAAVIGDPTQLHQVVMNLCTNALQAMASGGRLEVALDEAEITKARALSHGSLRPGAYARLCVSDTGRGIPTDVLDRMFDPFFTTKPVGKGTGLGLSLVHGIVSDLRGAIDVDTTVGRGTCVTIWLPLAGEAAAPLPPHHVDLPRGTGQSVMIVDDEPTLVALAEEMLAALGYEPIGFASSVAGLAAFRETPDRFDIVVTDETMPELVGTDLAREIRHLRPDVPIVLMTGYSSAQLQQRAREIGVRELLRKPLQSNAFARCLERVLRSSERRKVAYSS